MATTKFIEPFSVDVVGDVTSDKFTGVFKCKTRLSHRDALRRDQVRRSLLGADPDSASPRAESVADCLSECSVRILEAPSWWTTAGEGMDLCDDNVLAEVYKAMMACANAANKKIVDAGTQAKKDLAEG